MFKRKQIDQRVQKALFRKIDAMNRLGLTNDRVVGDNNKNQSFFIGDSLEPQDNSNPMNQMKSDNQSVYRVISVKKTIYYHRKINH